MSGYLVQGMLRYNTTTGTGTITEPAAFAIPAGSCTDVCVVGDDMAMVLDLSGLAGMAQFIRLHPSDQGRRAARGHLDR